MESLLYSQCLIVKEEVTLQVEGVNHYKRARGTNLVSEIPLSPFPNHQAIVAYCNNRSG